MVRSNYYLGKQPVNPSLRPTQHLAPTLSQWWSLAGQVRPAALQLRLSDRGVWMHTLRGTRHSYGPGDGLRVFKSSYAILPTNCGKPTIQKIPPLHGNKTPKVEFYF